MAKPPAPRPHTTPRAEAERAARLAREAAALRENLKKRKEQARARPPASRDSVTDDTP